MSPAVWPVSRSDGSVSVAVRFAFASTEARVRLEGIVTRWLDGRQDDGVDLNRDLTSLPVVTDGPAGTADVVIEGRSGSRMWKDWMVYITTTVESEDHEIKATQFIDLIGGGVRPVHTFDG